MQSTSSNDQDGDFELLGLQVIDQQTLEESMSSNISYTAETLSLSDIFRQILSAKPIIHGVFLAW